MITLEDIRSAQARIAGVAVSTPLVHYADFSSDRQTFPKPESFQPVGAFKLRGAYNKIASLSPDQRRQGVIAFSSGNHAQGVAYAARAAGTGPSRSRSASVPPARNSTTRNERPRQNSTS